MENPQHDQAAPQEEDREELSCLLQEALEQAEAISAEIRANQTAGERELADSLSQLFTIYGEN